MVPPGLAWLDLFRGSTGTALDQNMVVTTKHTVNPLTYTVELHFSESISMKNAVLVWNIFQKWAGRNGTVPQGNLDFIRVASPGSKESRIQAMRISVLIRERLGPDKTERP